VPIRCRTVPSAALALLLAALGAAPAARAGGGPLGIDHRLTYDNSGIWARSNQNALIAVLLVGEVGGAVWEGGEERFGRTLWQSIDATVIGGVSSVVLKRVFSRERPDQTSDPNRWFKGGGNQSFPSGEVTIREHPAVYALELLPVYDAIARMKVRAHWQSDVIAGFALGTAAGYFAHARSGTPLVLSVMPHAIYVGLKKTW
jgi:membrane-associated phospholipid phosphatase